MIAAAEVDRTGQPETSEEALGRPARPPASAAKEKEPGLSKDQPAEKEKSGSAQAAGKGGAKQGGGKGKQGQGVPL